MCETDNSLPIDNNYHDSTVILSAIKKKSDWLPVSNQYEADQWNKAILNISALQ